MSNSLCRLRKQLYIYTLHIYTVLYINRSVVGNTFKMSHIHYTNNLLTKT